VKLTHGFERRGKPWAAFGHRVVTTSTQEDHVDFGQCALGGYPSQKIEDANPIPIAAERTGKALNFVLPHGVVGITHLQEQEAGLASHRESIINGQVSELSR